MTDMELLAQQLAQLHGTTFEQEMTYLRAKFPDSFMVWRHNRDLCFREIADSISKALRVSRVGRLIARCFGL